MNYRNFLIFILLFFSSCVNQNYSKKINTEQLILQKYSNNGFTLIYSEKLFKNKIVNKKLNDRDLFVFQKNLKKNTTVKITNLLNNKSVIANVKNKAIYPNFYNSVVTSRIAKEIELDLSEPFISIESVDQNSVFYAGKAKTFEEEKNVANKAPVEGVNIVNISSQDENKKKRHKINKKFQLYNKNCWFLLWRFSKTGKR